MQRATRFKAAALLMLAACGGRQSTPPEPQGTAAPASRTSRAPTRSRPACGSTAWRRSCSPRPAPLPGLSSEQLFFVAYTQTYCNKQTPELEQIQVDGDVRSPHRFSVIGPLASSPAFAAAFSCPAGTPMHPARVCSVW